MSFKIFLFILCLWLASGLILEISVPYPQLIRYSSAYQETYGVENQTSAQNLYNYTQWFENMSRISSPDFGAQAPTWIQSQTALRGVFRIITNMLGGFPLLLTQMGMSAPIVAVIATIVGFFASIFFIELATGRDILGE